MVFSSLELRAGASHEVLLGGTATGDGNGGFYLEADGAGGTSVGTVTASG